MQPNYFLIYPLVREREDALRRAIARENGAAMPQPRSQERFAAFLRSLANQIDPQPAGEECAC